MKNQAPLVSICCIAFNHENYIRDAIEGFLMQKTGFPFEIIVHDDASTDNTAQIIKEYEGKHPGLFVTIYQTENQYSQGINPFIKLVLPRTRGKYIAFCEGDDYWTDPLKLQKQVDFLEGNEEYVMVADNAIWHDLNNNSEMPFSNLAEKDIELLELLEKRRFPTGGVLFRKLNKQILQEEVLGDTILWAYLTKFGRIRFNPCITSVYRRHDGGLTSSDSYQWAKHLEGWNKKLKENHPEVKNIILNKRNYSQFRTALTDSLHKKNYLNSFVSFFKCIRYFPYKNPVYLFRRIYLRK